MPLRQWLLGKLAGPAESKAVISIPPVISYPAQLFFGIADAQQPDNAISAHTAYRLFTLAYACMQFRATKLAEAPLWIAEEDEDGEAMLEGEHPLSELLEQPNPDMEMADLLEQVSLYLDATGACLLVKNRGRDSVPRSLYRQPRQRAPLRRVPAADVRRVQDAGAG
jgi:phage portal protein BeeE